MKKVVIIGGKGTAVVIAEQIYDAQLRYNMDIEVLGFAFDDPAYKDGINGWPVLCGTRQAYNFYKDDKDVYFVYSLYRSDILRERIALRDSLAIPPERFLSFVHPSTFVAKSVKLGQGCIILANCIINSNVKMNNFNTILSGTIIEHDTQLGHSNFIAAHSCIGSGIKIGNGNFIGLNSTFRTYVEIGNSNLIGMASCVLKNVGDDFVVVGNPARVLKTKN